MRCAIEMERMVRGEGEEDMVITTSSFAEVALNEVDDMIEINGRLFHKPFVEKPVSAEDHNIYIYFPSDYGGGSQRLFRKVRVQTPLLCSSDPMMNLLPMEHRIGTGVVGIPRRVLCGLKGPTFTRSS